MEDTVLKMMRAGLNEFTSAEKNIDRKVWVTKHPGQVIATISQVLWCASSESYINEMVENPFALQDWYTVNVAQLTQLIDLVRGNLDSVRRKIIVALVTTDVHARDIVESLVKEQISSV
jgi:dynein heavy chain